MENKPSLLESLFERAEEYGKTSLELIKLKALDKTSDLASSFVSRLTVTFSLTAFLVMVSLGVAIWLGEILGKPWYGFFIVSAFYGILAFILYFFMHKWLKRIVSNLIIKQLLK